MPILDLQYLNLDRTELASLADELQERAERIDPCLGKSQPQWVMCGGSDNPTKICPRCKRYGTLMAVVSDLRTKYDELEPGRR